MVAARSSIALQAEPAHRIVGREPGWIWPYAGLPRDFINDQMGQLMPVIKAAKLPCIWIGPPWGQEGGFYKKSNARVKALSDYLSQNVAPCHYVDSLPSSKPGELTTLDGVHLTPDATRLWDAYVMRSIDQIAATLPRQ